MKNFTLFLILQLLVFSVKAQSNFAIYGNAGLPIKNNFDNPPTHSAYADFGFRYYFHKGLSVSLEANTAFFKQSTDFNKPNANYFTQTNGVGLVIMNETKISSRSHIGIGIGGSNSYFSGRAYAQNEPYFYQLNPGAPPSIKDPGYGIKFYQEFLTFKAQILYKHTVNKYFDTQIGLSYHMSQGYFLDMYAGDVKNRKYDEFAVLFVGCIYKFKESKNHVKGSTGGQRTTPIKLRCPSF